MRKVILKILRRPYEWVKKYPPLAHIVLSSMEGANMQCDRTYRKKPARASVNIPSADFFKDKVAVITIAFNKPELVESQILCFQKNVSSDSYLIIADNSLDQKARQAILALCQKNNVGYISLPPNPRKQINLSHSIALNWVYYNLIQKIKPYGFGFVDHDLFPLQSTNIKEILEKHSLYGLYQERQKTNLKAWYLWAGFSFFRYSYLKEVGAHDKMNFSSVIVSTWQGFLELDTGGGNWLPLYSKTPANAVKHAIQTVDGVENIDGWVHLHAASQKSHDEIQENLRHIFNEKSIQ